jgi:hypothetical protein
MTIQPTCLDHCNDSFLDDIAFVNGSNSRGRVFDVISDSRVRVVLVRLRILRRRESLDIRSR